MLGNQAREQGEMHMPKYQFDRGDSESARRFAQLDSFTQGYIEAAFWTGDEESEIPSASFADLDNTSLASMVEDCKNFLDECRNLLDQTDADDHRHGVDFWLTRNRHGAGFWDRGYAHDIGNELTTAAHAYGSSDLYRGDDGKIHVC